MNSMPMCALYAYTTCAETRVLLACWVAEAVPNNEHYTSKIPSKALYACLKTSPIIDKAAPLCLVGKQKLLPIPHFCFPFKLVTFVVPESYRHDAAYQTAIVAHRFVSL